MYLKGFWPDFSSEWYIHNEFVIFIGPLRHDLNWDFTDHRKPQTQRCVWDSAAQLWKGFLSRVSCSVIHHWCWPDCAWRRRIPFWGVTGLYFALASAYQCLWQDAPHPVLLGFGGWRGHWPLLSSFCPPLTDGLGHGLFLKQGTGFNWFFPALWFSLWLSGDGRVSATRNRWLKWQRRKFIASSRSTDRWSNLTSSAPDRCPECERLNWLLKVSVLYVRAGSTDLWEVGLMREIGLVDSRGEKDLSPKMTAY